jgi:metal-responsive CopG/Arc/MetJ family transcriptional regulator
MQSHARSIRKVTISLPAGLVQYADRLADQLGLSRSEVIGRALAQAQATEEERLAAEGYQFYAHESSAFATASAGPFAEVLDDAG